MMAMSLELKGLVDNAQSQNETQQRTETLADHCRNLHGD